MAHVGDVSRRWAGLYPGVVDGAGVVPPQRGVAFWDLKREHAVGLPSSGTAPGVPLGVVDTVLLTTRCGVFFGVFIGIFGSPAAADRLEEGGAREAVRSRASGCRDGESGNENTGVLWVDADELTTVDVAYVLLPQEVGSRLGPFKR